MASSWLFMRRRLQFGNSITQFCNATSNYDKLHYIRCLRAEFAAKHTNAPLSLRTRWKMEPGFGSWQSPDISCSIPLISRYHCLDPTNRDISRVHCIGILYHHLPWSFLQWESIDHGNVPILGDPQEWSYNIYHPAQGRREHFHYRQQYQILYISYLTWYRYLPAWYHHGHSCTVWLLWPWHFTEDPQSFQT